MIFSVVDCESVEQIFPLEIQSCEGLRYLVRASLCFWVYDRDRHCTQLRVIQILQLI